MGGGFSWWCSGRGLGVMFFMFRCRGGVGFKDIYLGVFCFFAILISESFFRDVLFCFFDGWSWNVLCVG